jgi:hypothetical protein
LRSYLEEIVAAPGLENRSYDRRDSLRWPRDILYPLKLALDSLTGGDSSIDRYSSLAGSKPRSNIISEIKEIIPIKSASETWIENCSRKLISIRISPLCCPYFGLYEVIIELHLVFFLEKWLILKTAWLMTENVYVMTTCKFYTPFFALLGFNKSCMRGSHNFREQ